MRLTLAWNRSGRGEEKKRERGGSHTSFDTLTDEPLPVCVAIAKKKKKGEGKEEARVSIGRGLLAAQKAGGWDVVHRVGGPPGPQKKRKKKGRIR